MVLLKELQNENHRGKVVIEVDSDTLCDLHNITYRAAKEEPRFEELALEIANLYEMLHHGHLTDFGIYKNAKYFRDHDSFEHWEKDTEA